MHKILAFCTLVLAACQSHTPTADLDEAKAASADFCTCINIPAKEYGPCSKAKYPRWTAIHDKLSPLRDKLDAASLSTLTTAEAAVSRCKGVGDEVWHYVNMKPKAPAAPTEAPAPTAPSPSTAPNPEK